MTDCPIGYEEIGINTGWCVETTTDADIIKLLLLILITVIITYILSKKL